MSSDEMKPTMMFRYERRTREVSTAPDDFMQVVIGKKYPTTTVHELVLQQLWADDFHYPVEEWRDVPIVDEKVKAKPDSELKTLTNALDESVRRKLIRENIAKNKEFAEKIRKEKLKRRGR